MDEGVDPTHMCRNLVDKVNQSEQLRVVTDPDILVLFEDWQEELEKDICDRVAADPGTDPATEARRLGLSERGAAFMAAKLKREGKLP